SPAVRAWFRSSFPAPTEAQERGWPAIAAGEHTLILAPTGSGKTLAAFLWGIDRLSTPDAVEREPAAGPRLLYISPLRALAVDIERNLRSPLVGIGHAADRLGLAHNPPTVGLRTGDTSGAQRRRLARNPPDLLITTPESLYLMLTSAVRETLAGGEAVSIGEIHALAATKRGAHLMLSLERLEALGGRPPQRIGLSATQRPLDEIATFLGGFEPVASGAANGSADADGSAGASAPAGALAPADEDGPAEADGTGLADATVPAPAVGPTEADD